jgi:ABC-2 type transport system permease protein
MVERGGPGEAVVTGFATLLRKELLEQWRTRRLVIVGIVFLLFGLMSPVLAKYTPEILKSVGTGMPGATITLPPASTADAVGQLAKNVGQLGILIAILLSMGSVAGEKERGTAAFLLTMPAGRAGFLLAKLVAIGTTLLVAMALATAGAWAYTTALFEPLPVGGTAAMGVVLWLALLAFAAITFLASTVFSSQLVAGGVGFVAFVVLSIVAALPVVGEWSPMAATAVAIDLGLGKAPTAAIPAIAGCIACILVPAAAAVAVFRRQEL